MKVLLDTSYAQRGASGTATYVERLRAALEELGTDVVAVGDEGRPAPGGGGWRSARNLLRDRWWLDVALPRLAAHHGVDVVHHPLPAVFRPRRATVGIAQVVTVHDLAFELLPEHFDPRFARWASKSHRAAALAADAVVAVSRTTAGDVRERWGVPVDRIVVAPHGPGQWRARDVRHGETVRATSRPAGRPYLLYVGDDEPRKDLPTLRAAHALLRDRLGDAAPDLVLAGQVRAPEREPQGGAAAGTPRDPAATVGSASMPGAAAEGPATGDGAAVSERRVDRPDRDALLALMDGALALVHPALHEGVGLTPLEAMARGLPVVVARSPGLTETCQDAARYFSPGDAAALADELERLVGDPRRLEALAVAGRRVAGDRSWTIAARRHVEAYTLAVEHARRTGLHDGDTTRRGSTAGTRDAGTGTAGARGDEDGGDGGTSHRPTDPAPARP